MATASENLTEDLSENLIKELLKISTATLAESTTIEKLPFIFVMQSIFLLRQIRLISA